MKKRYLFSLVLAAFLVNGCSNTGNSQAAHPVNPSLSSNAVYTHIHDNTKLKKIVVKAAQDKGWRITEFKANALIAEKFDQTPKATTISFINGHVDFDNAEGTGDDDIVDLKEYIEDLASSQSRHR